MMRQQEREFILVQMRGLLENLPFHAEAERRRCYSVIETLVANALRSHPQLLEAAKAVIDNPRSEAALQKLREALKTATND